MELTSIIEKNFLTPGIHTVDLNIQQMNKLVSIVAPFIRVAMVGNECPDHVIQINNDSSLNEFELFFLQELYFDLVIIAPGYERLKNLLLLAISQLELEKKVSIILLKK